ncbi:Retrotransposon Ty1/copia like protein [Gracilaria domingensis]|nr:Retrotransposon Ty1/copia like protein [Gracilaria domingensis]
MRRVENSNVVRALVAGSSVGSSRKWYVDSGATVHMNNDIEHFTGELLTSTKKSVEIGEGNKLQIEGQGAIPCQAVVFGNRFDVHLTNVQYVPDLKCNLISVVALQNRGYKVLFYGDTHARKLCKVLDGTSGEVVLLAVGNLSSGLYEVLLCPNDSGGSHQALVSKSDSEKAVLWHRRLGHCCENHMRETLKLVDVM